MRLDRIRKLAFLTISQTGIRYPNSRLSEKRPGLPDDALRAGDRFPWLRLKLSAGPRTARISYAKIDDTRFTLIVIGQPAPPGGVPGLGDLLRTYLVPGEPANGPELARARIPRIAFYLLRPDGYVGLAGIQLDTEAVEAVRRGAPASWRLGPTRPGILESLRLPAPHGEGDVVAAEPEGVREGHVDLALDFAVGSRVEIAPGIGCELVDRGGMTPQVADRSETANSSAPAPPSRWPVMDLVEPNTSFRAWSPNTALTASVSAMSPWASRCRGR